MIESSQFKRFVKAQAQQLLVSLSILSMTLQTLAAENEETNSLHIGPPSSEALWRAGPAYDRFELTLDSGNRTEAVGPFFYREQKETQHTWAIPPLLSSTRDPATESYEFDFIYPLLTYDRFGEQYRWQFFQLLSFAGGPSQTEKVRKRFTLFPVYFQQRASDPNENYTAVGPVYGHL